MNALMTRIIKHPVLFLPILVVGIGLCIWHLPDLTIDLVDQFERTPQQEFYEHAVAEFGDDLFTVITVKARHGDIFTPESLTLLDTLTTRMETLEGVQQVESLTTVKHVKGGKGFVRVEKRVNLAALNAETISQLKEDVFGNDLFVNNLISEDGKTAAIHVFLEERGKAFEQRIIQEFENILAEYADEDHTISQRSIPRIQAENHVSLRRNLQMFLPLAVLIVCGVVFVYYRRFGSFLVPLLTMSASLLTTLGAMAYFDFPLTPATLVVLPLVITLTCAESERIVFTYPEEIQSGTAARDALLLTVRHHGLPLFLSTITLCLGIGMFAASPSPMLRQFGMVSAGSLLISGGIAFTLPLALCRYVFPGETRARPLLLFSLAGRIAEWYERYRWFTLGALLLLFAFAVTGLFKLRIDATLPGSAATGFSLSRQHEDARSDLAGISPFYVLIESGRENRIKEPEVLRQIERLQHFIAEQQWCHKTLSFADYMKLVQREMQGGAKEMEVIPGSRELVSQYLILLGNVDLKRYVNANYSTANIAVSHHLTTSQALTAAIQSIRSYVDQNVSTDLAVRVTGYEIVRNDMTTLPFTEQVTYLGLTLGIIFLILSGLFLSFKMSLAAMLPSFLALVLHFGIMGWLGFPLHVETSLLAIVVLGVTINTILHFLIRYRTHLFETNDQELAVGTTIYREGEPVFLTSVGLFLGFGLFFVSGSSLTSHLGLFSALVMLYALITVFFINPLILQAIQIITVWDFVQFNIKVSLLRKSQLFKNLRRSQIKKVILLGSVREVPTNEFVVRQDEPGQEMYMLLTGKAEVFVEKNAQKHVLGLVEPGDLVGEMALLGAQVRSANVVTLEESKLLRIDEKSLKRVQQSYPRIAATLFLNISVILSERLKEQILAAQQSA